MDFRRLFDLFHYQQARFPSASALARKTTLGWERLSTQACIELTDKISAILLQLGLERGDRAAIIARGGSPWWLCIDMAMQQLGIVVVPVHANASETELQFMLNAADVKCCLVENRELYDKLLPLQPTLHQLQYLMTFYSLPDLPNLEDRLGVPGTRQMEVIQVSRSAIHEDDLATIIFTSGATGQPKGVCLSHKNIVSNLKATITIVPLNAQKRAASFLPLSHIFERMVVYAYLATGTHIYFLQPNKQLPGQLREIRPHFFTAVPLIIERFYRSIREQGRALAPWREQLILWAIRQGKKYDGRYQIAPWYWIKLLVADALVYQRWRRQLGGKVQGIIVGGAALRTELARLFSAAGLNIIEGYGLTETSPVVAMSRFEPGGRRFGSVGQPVSGVEVRIQAAEGQSEGEILVRSPGLMQGYLGQEAPISEDGWFHTGDVGYLGKHRFLYLSGRIGDRFKTGSGRFIVPYLLEQKIIASPFIDQCMVIGAQQAHPGALVIPNFERLQQWAAEQNVHWTAPQYMVLDTKVQQLYQHIIEEINSNLPAYQQIKGLQLIHEPWSEENGMLTPTLKLKRSRIREHYAKTIAHLYQD